MFYCIVIKFAHIEKIYESFVSIIIAVIANCVTEAKKNAYRILVCHYLGKLKA
jgi:hypothetical protein